MKPASFVFALLVAAALETSTAKAVGITLQDEWQPEADVEIPEDAVVASGELRRMQATTTAANADADAAVSSAASGSSATADTAATETEAPAPATIMVLLPDFLAPSYSGSGSTMFFDGAVGDEDHSKSAGSVGGSSEASAARSLAPRGFALAAALATSAILFALGAMA
ncbi:hypothetical protein BBJ28_00015619 [Nothophytophthora sp. Chile5]|nr:hypothetical protein BBJ28_00015619 [Nothophytophthora sp. Chile5]